MRKKPNIVGAIGSVKKAESNVKEEKRTDKKNDMKTRKKERANEEN